MATLRFQIAFKEGFLTQTRRNAHLNDFSESQTNPSGRYLTHKMRTKQKAEIWRNSRLHLHLWSRPQILAKKDTRIKPKHLIGDHKNL